MDWLENPEELIAQNKDAAALYQQYGKIKHLSYNTFTTEQIDQLIEFVEQPADSKASKVLNTVVVACP